MPFMTSRAFLWPLCLIYFFTASTLATRSLSERSEQTQAQCTNDFDWATSSQGSTPCLLTAYVWGSCFTGNWDVPQLPQGSSYTNPNATTANDCTCSWAAYNLISACTACQGFDSAIANWAGYSQSCGGFETDTYFPSNITLPTGTAIPFWAGTDPRSWNDARFDTAQAKLIAQEHKPDFVQGQTPPDAKKSKPPVGAIAGGVVGGVAVLVIGAAIAFWFVRKRNRDHAELAGETSTHPYIRPQIHGRSVSDVSGKSILTPQSMSVIQRPGTIYTTAGTIHTRTGSAHSLLPYGSGYTSPVRVMSPPLTSQLVSREDVIEPFTLRPTSPLAPGMTRKPSETTMATTYNNHEVPVGAFIASSEGSSERTRLNPPAYSPYISPASSPEPGDPTPTGRTDFAPGHRTRHEKGSVDTQQSYDSSTTHAPHDSASGIDEVIGRMRLTMASESVVGAHTVSTGGSANVLSRPTHKPSVSNPDNDTLG